MELSFKWKPPEFNTIDFLITTEKTESGDDIINNTFKQGVSFRNKCPGQLKLLN